ncbi:calcium/proton exchanger [Neolentinus lepideus HHB14362 ss-1]|uniref:Calcium/proton exchanger n=1 Tax=Neolentinus lepideus HHB14362 ss-1 TaxID=1314782 RepID=A0A165VM71_9AGAM|nr:calcium/proton exchanger [Neolentinus lepideus HHB14362 ss-1]
MPSSSSNLLELQPTASRSATNSSMSDSEHVRVHTPTAESGRTSPTRRDSQRANNRQSRQSTVSTVPDPIKGTRRLFRRCTTVLSEKLKPDRPIAPSPTNMRSLRAIVTASWLNILLVFIPLSWVFHFADLNNTLVFVFSFLAIIPLAKLLAFATEEMSLRVGQTLAGLLNATLGNAVELIVAIIALVKCELTVVQSSLVGSILSNLLLVLGMCFFAGGTRFSEQGFGASASQINSSLLILSVIAVLLPAAFQYTDSSSVGIPQENSEILSVSHGTAIILLFIYGSYIVFQLFSHKTMFDDRRSNVLPSTLYQQRKEGGHIFPRIPNPLHSRKKKVMGGDGLDQDAPETNNITDTSPVMSPNPAANGDVETGVSHEDEEKEEEEVPQLNVFMSVALLVVITVLVAVTAEFLVDSIHGLTESGAISQEFVGMVLLPIVGNAAEHVTAVTVSVKDKLTLSIGVAVGSSIQIALFVIPFIVTLGWIINKPLSLLFDPFEAIALFLSVLTVNYVVADGKSNWLEGMILMCACPKDTASYQRLLTSHTGLYLILAVAFWFYTPASSQFTCS